MLEQLPLVITHSNILSPIDSAFTVLFGAVRVAMLAPPTSTDQLPMPSVGEFAVSVVTGVLAQSVWLLPALEAEAGITSTSMVELFGAHTPLETVHSRMLLPPPAFENVLLACSELLKTPLPTSTLQVPVPGSGGVAARVREPELMQSV